MKIVTDVEKDFELLRDELMPVLTVSLNHIYDYINLVNNNLNRLPDYLHSEIPRLIVDLRVSDLRENANKTLNFMFEISQMKMHGYVWDSDPVEEMKYYDQIADMEWYLGFFNSIYDKCIIACNELYKAMGVCMDSAEVVFDFNDIRIRFPIIKERVKEIIVKYINPYREHRVFINNDVISYYCDHCHTRVEKSNNEVPIGNGVSFIKHVHYTAESMNKKYLCDECEKKYEKEPAV